jgi:hypothetical protein
MLRRTDRLVLAYLRYVARKVHTMAIDVSKLVASEVRLVGDVDTLLTLAANTQAQLEIISQQLADAIAANDPVAQKAVQDAIDGVVASLDTEAAKVEATQVPPVGATGPSV